jgi:peptide/nickel transport system ATP-binding protein
MSDHLLEVNGLTKHFPIYGGIIRRQVAKVHALDGISFAIKRGEALGVVGESGCGKSTLGKALIKLESPSAGEVLFAGQSLNKLSPSAMRPLRKQMQMVFQDPFESLNSRHSIGMILAEPFIIHKLGNSASRRQWVADLLAKVGLPVNAVERFPHEFSGGQRQRIGIARAIALRPELLVCDEPVSALDVSIQAQIINLFLKLQQELALTLVFISHDLAVVKHVSDRIAVMYLGKLVEIANAQQIYQRPQHPYTQALVAAIPQLKPGARQPFRPLAGEIPSPVNPPKGCRFHPRCPYAQPRCQQQEPALTAIDQANNQLAVACHFVGQLQPRTI